MILQVGLSAGFSLGIFLEAINFFGLLDLLRQCEEDSELPPPWVKLSPELGRKSSKSVWLKGSLSPTLSLPVVRIKTKLNPKTGWCFPIFFIFTAKFGEMILFDEHIFQMGWNHKLENHGNKKSVQLRQPRVIFGGQNGQLLRRPQPPWAWSSLHVSWSVAPRRCYRGRYPVTYGLAEWIFKTSFLGDMCIYIYRYMYMINMCVCI